jgi:hypothetical protein
MTLRFIPAPTPVALKIRVFLTFADVCERLAKVANDGHTWVTTPNPS